MRFSLKDFMRATGARFHGGRSMVDFGGVTTDGREARAGDLFFALKGPNFDGHDYVLQAIEAGAAGAVVREGRASLVRRAVDAIRDEAVLLETADPLDALGDLARFMRRRFGGRVVSVTGSNGKTTTKELMALMAGRRFRTGFNRGNFNNLIGVPRTLLGFEGTEEIWILELGINQPGEMDRLAGITAPEIGVLTALSEAHLEGLESAEGIAREKGRLFAAIPGDGTAVVPYGHPLVPTALGGFGGKVVTFGAAAGADVCAESPRWDGDGMRFTVQAFGDRREAFMRGGSRPTVDNALAAIAAARAAGVPFGQAVEALAEFAPVKGRLNVLRGEWTIVDDTYNANPESVMAALKFLKQDIQPARAVCCLGDMKELGKAAERWHRAIGFEAATLGYDCIVAVGRMAPWVAEGAKDGRIPPAHVIPCDTIENAVPVLRDRLRPGDGVLVKGSRAMRMEKIVEALLQGEKHDRGERP